MDVLAHPFRLALNGSAATVLDGSTDANADAIAVLAGTRLGERVLVPGFGISDPTFSEVDPAELNAGLDTYGPDGVTVTDVTTVYDGTTARVRIEFED